MQYVSGDVYRICENHTVTEYENDKKILDAFDQGRINIYADYLSQLPWADCQRG